METFVSRTLTKITKAAKGVAKFKELRAACDEALEKLAAAKAAGENGEDAEAYFAPLRLACESQHAPAMEEALDCVQKLIAYGYLRGTASGPASPADGGDGDDAASAASSEADAAPGGSTMDGIVATICGCDDFDDDGVQLQVIKALLTAVTSNTCAIHEGSLLVAVRSCYNIHLVTRNAVNKTTAKATLTQMLSIVFQRMEAHDARGDAPPEAPPPAFAVGDGCAVPGVGDGVLAALGEDGLAHVELKKWASADGARVTLRCDAAALRDEAGDEAEPRVLGVAPTPEHCTIEDGALVLAKRSHLAAATPFGSAHHKDAFLLFRALCKLSMKGGGDGDAPAAPSEPISMQSKVLSLELLLSVLEHAGPSFRGGARFVGAVRQYLCVSLLKNCTSNVTHVVALSLRIFVALISKFRDHLKAEIEVFIHHIFLRILDSDNSTHEHKMLVLEVFHKLCGDTDSLVEIFLSYDADFESVDVFKHIVVALARVVKGSASAAALAAAQGGQGDAGRRAAANDGALKRLALSGLVATLASLAKGCDVALDAGDVAWADLETGGDGAVELDKVAASAPLASAAVGHGGDGDGGDGGDDSPAPPDAPKRHDSVQAFDLKQRLQEDLKDGILKFNMKPKHGLKTLHGKGHVDETDPKSVAAFLHAHAAALDKTVVGDYLGKEEAYQDGFCVKVLHEYVDAMDFTGLEFDVAIRHFLSGFRLPGEAQKIDRMMEKYAERYCALNKAVFPSADVAFVLAFSVIMLQTDLHNPAVKEEKKMTKEGFRRNNRGICNGADLDGAFLDEIFDRIKLAPITLAEDDRLREKEAAKEGTAASQLAQSMGGAFGLGGPTPQRRRAEAFVREREDMVRASVTLLRQSRPAFSAFPSGDASKAGAPKRAGKATAALVAPKMFEVAWGPALSAFSHALERIFRGPRPTALALRGLKMSATIASCLGLDVACLSLVNALAAFTTLYGPPKPLLPRHAACAETLLGLASHDECAEHLGASWLPLLRVASKVAHLRLVSTGARTDDAYFGGEEQGKGSAASRSAEAERKTREEENARALAAHSGIDDAALDALFARSAKLSAVGVEAFITQLCAVSAAELSTGDALDLGATFALSEADVQAGGAYDDQGGDGAGRPLPPLGAPPRPRVYSLQRLVDVADGNIAHRPRLAWDRMWRVLAAHFARAGAHANADVARYAVDSLRQLSLKFLSKEELKAFTFQRAFLRPFERVFRANRDEAGRASRADVREYVVACVDVLVQARAANLKSGWRSILSVLGAAAGDGEPRVAALAFASLGQVIDGHLEAVAVDFVDLVNCAVAFASAPGRDEATTAMARAALAKLERCGRALADGTIRDAVANSDDAKDQAAPAGGDGAQLELWWPLLLGLAQRVADPREVVRNGALSTLRRVLERDCGDFGAETWRLVFRGVLFPSLESAWTDDAPRPGSTRPTDAAPPPSRDAASWLDTTAPAVLDACVALYAARGGGAENAPLLGEMLALLGDCVCQDAEALSRVAVDALARTLAAIPAMDPAAPPDTWDVAAHGVAHLVDRALPPDLRAYLLPAPGDEKGDAGAVAAGLDRGATIARLVASLQLLPLAGGLLVSAAEAGALSEGGADALLRSMATSRAFGAAFDRDARLRAECLSERLMGADEAPDLVAMTVAAGAEAFGALRALDGLGADYAALAEPRLLGLCRDVLRDYAAAERAAAQGNGGLPLPPKLLDAATPLALDALAFVRDLPPDKFAKHCAWLVPVLSELIVCQSVQLRTTVAAVFATRLPSALLGRTQATRVQTPSDAALKPELPQPPATPAAGETGDADETPAAGGPSRRHPGTVAKPYRLFESQ